MQYLNCCWHSFGGGGDVTQSGSFLVVHMEQLMPEVPEEERGNHTQSIKCAIFETPPPSKEIARNPGNVQSLHKSF